MVPGSVTSIGVGAFGGCTGLTSIVILNQVTSIARCPAIVFPAGEGRGKNLRRRDGSVVLTPLNGKNKANFLDKTPMDEDQSKTLAFQELRELRRKTEAVAKLFQDQLAHHLETLRPVLTPERLLGKHLKGDSLQPNRAVAELQQQYRELAASALDLPRDLDPSWVNLVGNRPELCPCEYIHQTKTDREAKAITMTSPLRWLLTFASEYSVAHVRRVLAGKEPRQPEHLRQFVVNALVMGLVISRTPGLVQLFSALRYQLNTEPVPELGTLPLVTITSCLSSFRPTDDLILAATAFSGVPAFIELLDLHAVTNLQDPLKAALEPLLR